MGQPILPIPNPGRPARPLAPRTSRWVDVLILCTLLAAGYGVLHVVTHVNRRAPSGAPLDLRVIRLPLYAAYSTLRMAVAYVISLVFSLAYAKLAARTRLAERFMLPLLDILQSIPILSFTPGVVLGLAALFHGQAIGLEIAAVLLIFTSQAWNLAFSFHQSLMTVPADLGEAATVYRLGAWRRFTRLELPFGAISLIANSMMSWAGGWFFLIFAEEFTMGPKSFRLPGLGSYLAGAAETGDTVALVLGLVTLVVVIVLLDQLLWRPLVAWSDRFKIEQSSSAEVPHSVVLEVLQGSAVVDAIQRRFLRPLAAMLDRVLSPSLGGVEPEVGDDPRSVRWWRRRAVPVTLLGGILLLVAWGAIATVRELAGMPGRDWGLVGVSAAATFGRTTLALLLAAAWTVPVGVAIGMNPRWAHRLQPIVQVVASVPATAIFPIVVLALVGLPGGLNVGAVLLMLLGTQWYVLFNVIAGAMAIPSDLREAATNCHVTGWRRWRTLILPAIFPYLVTGMITATGGAWNASIVAELVTVRQRTVSTVGLGSLVMEAYSDANFPLLLAGTIAMAAVVITMNRLVWRRLYHRAETRYRLE
jgi:NitT/TauT family transport system permease protein